MKMKMKITPVSREQQWLNPEDKDDTGPGAGNIAGAGRAQPDR